MDGKGSTSFELAKPMRKEETRMNHVYKEYDVVVIGGGVSGIVAATAAARQGVKTLIVEAEGYLGGNATFGIPFLGFLDVQRRQITSGIAEEVVNRLVDALQANHLPVAAAYSADELCAVVLSDKKRNGSTITYVLPHAIGDCRLHKMPVADLPALIEQAIKA